MSQDWKLLFQICESFHFIGRRDLRWDGIGFFKTSFSLLGDSKYRDPFPGKRNYKIKNQRRLANSFVQGATQMSDIESESKLFLIEKLLEELVEGNDRIVSSGFHVIVWDRKKDAVEEKTNVVLGPFRGMNQAEGVKEDYGCMDVFSKFIAKL